MRIRYKSSKLYVVWEKCESGHVDIIWNFLKLLLYFFSTWVTLETDFF